jgi:hypothetical protein
MEKGIWKKEKGKGKREYGRWGMSGSRMPDTRYRIPDAGCPEKPEIFDFIVFRGSAIPGTGNRDRMQGTIKN